MSRKNSGESDDAMIELSIRTFPEAHAASSFNDEDTMAIPDLQEPFQWADKQIKRQNRCFLAFLTILLIAVVAVGAMYQTNILSTQSLRGDSSEGVLSQEFEGVKEQEKAEGVHHSISRDYFNQNKDVQKNQKAQSHDQNGEGTTRGKKHNKQHKPHKSRNKTNDGEHSSGILNGRDKHHVPSKFKNQENSLSGQKTAHEKNKNNHKHKQNPTENPSSATMQPTAEVFPSNPPSGKTSTSSSHCNFDNHQQWLSSTVTLQDGIMYEVVEQFAHDHTAFVQGLTYAEGTLWESNGLYGKSTVRILDPDTIEIIKTINMPAKLFGEGMTYYDGKLYQITWKSRKGFIYNATTLDIIDRFEFQTTKNQGWGITWDPCEEEFIVTDGSPNLHFWDKLTLAETRKIKVTRMDGTEALELNEIEWYRGKILANVWYEDVLLVIDPTTGTVEKEYDFSALFPKADRKKLGCDVFNGISVSEDEDILYVTGKKWDRMFKIRLLS